MATKERSKPRWKCPACSHHNSHNARVCKCGAARPFKRAGLHPLDCPSITCDGYVYATVAQLQSLGLPVCPCGTAYVPREVELAELLGIEDCAAVDEYRRAIESVWHGQEAHASRLDRNLREPHDVVMSRIATRRREDARKRRVTALKPAAEPMAF